MDGIPSAGKAGSVRNLNRRDSTLWIGIARAPRACGLAHHAREATLVSVDLTSDEISATGGRQRFAPFFKGRLFNTSLPD